MTELTLTQIFDMKDHIRNRLYLQAEDLPNCYNFVRIRDFKSFLKMSYKLNLILNQLLTAETEKEEKRIYKKLMNLCKKYRFTVMWNLLTYNINSVLFNWAEKNNWSIK